MGSLSFVLPYPPSWNRVWRYRVIVPKDRRKKPFVSSYESEEGRAFKLAVGRLLAGTRPLLGALELRMTLYRPRKSGDLTNRLKLVEDALQGLAFHDDAQIAAQVTRRLEDPERPRVEVTIIEIGPEGIPL